MAIHSGPLFHGETSSRRHGRRPDLGPLCPLVFSLTGLLADSAALVSNSNDLSPSLVFVLIAAAPALAAIAAISYAGDDVRSGGMAGRGWN